MKPLSARSLLLLLILSISSSLILGQGDAQPSARGQSAVTLAKAEGIPVEAERDQKVREFMLRGTRHYENAEFQEALGWYENAQRLAPHQPSLKAVIDHAQANLRSQQALLAGLSAADAKPSKVVKSGYRAACDLFEKGDYNQAYGEFYKVWLLAGDYKSTRNYLKEIVKARDASPTSSPQAEPSPGVETPTGGATETSGKTTDAVTDKVRLERARAFLKQGEYDLAAGLFKEVLENDPQNAPARRGLERAQTAAEDEKQARQDDARRLEAQERGLQENLRRQETDREIETVLARASAALDAGEYGSAMDAYRQVASVDPENRQARRGIDDVSKAQAAEERTKQEATEEERRGAAEAERRATVEKTADAIARAEKHAKAGEFGAAIEAYNVALAADSENRKAASGLKKAETAQQRLEEEGVKAKAQAEQARLRAEAEKGQREREAAEQAKGEAARREIADAVARAEKHAKAGEFGAAIEAYNVALAADPENREAARGLKKAETAQQRLEEEGVKAKAQAEQARLRAEAEREQREREMADSGSPFAEKAKREAAEREIAVPVERAESHAKAGEPVQAIGVRQVALAADSDDREAAQSIKKMEAALERAAPEKTEADAKRPAEKAQGDLATQTDSPSPRPAADREKEPAPRSQMTADAQTTGSAETVAGQTAGTEAKGPAESEKADAKAAANALVAEANALVAEKNYDEALKKIGLALDLDPDNGRAQRLRAKIRKKAGQGEEEGLRTTRREAIVMQRDAQDAYESGDLAQSRQIWARIIEIDPENKLASTMLEETAQEHERQLRDEAQRKEAVEREQAAIGKMNAPVGIETEEPTPLVEFLESLSLITGISFSVAQGADATVNVKVIDKPLHEVLDLVLLPKGLKWTRRTDDVIVVEADLKTAVYNLTTDEMAKVQTLLNNGNIQRALWGPSGEKPLEGILLDLDERNAILLSVDSAGNQEKLAAFLDQLRKEQPVELLTNFYTVRESDGPQIKALIDAVMRAEKTPYDLERNVSLDGKTLIVRDTPRSIAKIEELLQDRQFIRTLQDAKIEFASFSLAPREAMAEDRELSLDFFNNAVEMIETFLYAEEGRAKAREEGRRMWADPSVFQLTVTDYPERIRQVADFIATLPQLKKKEKEEVIRPKYLESGDLATELSDVLGLEEARAEEGAAGAAMVTRSLRTEGEMEFRGLNIRVRRVNENDVADEYDDSVELILRSPTQSSEVTLNEFMSTYFDDYEIVAEEIRPSGTLGEGRVKLIVRYVPQGLEYVQEEAARAEEERARAAEEEEAPKAAEEGPMKPVIKSFGNQNAVIVRYEDPADLIKIKNLVAELDRPIPQVSIETRFVTVNEQRAKEFSSEFAFLDKGDPRNIGWGFIDTAEIPRAGRDEIQPVSGRMVGEIWRDALNGGFGDYTLLDGVLHNFLGNYVDWELTLLEVEGIISFVNGPHIVVMDGETASFVITNGATSLPRYYEGGLLNPGLNVLPVTGLTTTQNQAQTQNQNIGQDQGFNQGQQGQDQNQVLLGTRDLVSLDVEPQVTSPESILLEIDVVITDNGFHWNSYRGPWGGEAGRNYAGDFFSRARPSRRRSSLGLVTAAGATTPVQALVEEPMEAEFRFNPDMGGSRKEVETRARIKDGGTIVLGGWTGEFSQDMTTGVPGLRNLPLLGKLFFSKNYYSTQKTNLLCFLSGHLVD